MPKNKSTLAKFLSAKRNATLKNAHPKLLTGQSDIPVADWYMGGKTYSQNAINMALNNIINSGKLRFIIQEFIKNERMKDHV